MTEKKRETTTTTWSDCGGCSCACRDDDDVVEQNHQMREEETACIAKGVKRKRGHECDVCEKVFRYSIQVGQTHAYSHERETV